MGAAFPKFFARTRYKQIMGAGGAAESRVKVMTGKERMARILKRQKTDCIGLYEHFFGGVPAKSGMNRGISRKK